MHIQVTFSRSSATREIAISRRVNVLCVLFRIISDRHPKCAAADVLELGGTPKLDCADDRFVFFFATCTWSRGPHPGCQFWLAETQANFYRGRRLVFVLHSQWFGLSPSRSWADMSNRKALVLVQRYCIVERNIESTKEVRLEVTSS